MAQKLEELGPGTLGYIAGWLEGEGSFNIHENTPKISVSSTDLDTLQNVLSIVGGSICGPQQRGNNKPIWQWYLYGKPAADIMKSIYHLLCNRRRVQIDKVLLMYIERSAEERDLLRSNASKGIPKTQAHREAISKARKGLKVSEEVRLNMSKAQKIASKIREEKKRAAKALSSV